jgi:hypothetical protein
LSSSEIGPVKELEIPDVNDDMGKSLLLDLYEHLLRRPGIPHDFQNQSVSKEKLSIGVVQAIAKI